ncbi:hypothetical protein Q5P01_005095 [Channa striata]|uniref:Uncharacterized protein n=1 Tax=Channa striata TaxID=64152 RepID=A0AA88T0Z1_CHASR|nr:hypothetical protein Q5P01_005095 [Channa striata]
MFLSVCSRMDLKHILCLLLSAAALTVFGEDGDNEAHRWTRQSLPLMLDTHTQLLNTPLFRGQVEDEDNGGLKTLCGIECQSGLLPIDQTEQERILGYETVGRRRGGRRRGGRKDEGEAAKEEGEEQLLEEGEEQNSIDGDVVRRRNKGKSRRRGRREFEEKGKGKQKRLHRVRRSIEPRKQPAFRWTRVKQTRIPQGWFHTDQTANSVSSDYDYALLELKRPIKQKYMKLGVAPSTAPLARIHFSGFDADKGLLDGGGDEKVVYRFCSVAKKSDDLMYQHCDAEPGATGAGVYIRLRKEVEDAGRRGKFQRRVIGVFSGHQWVEMEGGEQRDFNVAVRITAPKYAQICHWIHGDPSLCRDV